MRYLVITNRDITNQLDDQVELIPAGTVVNEVEWDGVTPYEPPPHTRLEPAK